MAHNLLSAIASGNKSAILKKRIINYYIYHGNSTISELSRALDISIPTVTKLIEEMCDSKILLAYGKLETNEGRHPHLYGLNPESGYYLGVDINLGSVSMALMNFSGEIIEQLVNQRRDLTNSAAGLENLCKLIE